MSAAQPAASAGGEQDVAASAPPVPPAKEAETVREVLLAVGAMKDGDEFYVVSFRWWQAWSAYAHFDEAAMDVSTTSERPGPLTAAELAAPGAPQELRPGVVEDYDYKLLPRAAYNKLEAWYGSTGPRFVRVALNRAALGQAKDVVVELYPVRATLGLVGPDGRPTGETTSLLLSRRLRLWEAQRSIIAAVDGLLGVRSAAPGPVPLPRRIWYKRVIPEPAGEDRDVNSDGYVVVQDQSEDAPQTPVETEEEALAYDIFEVGETGVSPRLLDLLEAGPVGLQLLVEFRETAKDPWPRTAIVEAWKYRLLVGSEVDAADSHGSWYEALVVGRQENGGAVALKVHYLGWGSKFDDDISLAEPKHRERLAKRNAKVPYWRDLGIGDPVELKDAASKSSPTWFAGKVEATVTEGEAMATADRAGNAVDPLIAEEAALPGKRLLVVANTSTRAPLRRWVAALGESICCMHTHLSEQRPAARPRASDLYGSYGGYDGGTRGTPAIAGAVGLRNLGNTCFMNSMLQCVSHAAPLTSYFLQGAWRPDMNETNPLGMNGRLATDYAAFLQQVWGGSHTVVAPSTLKRTIGTFNSTFAGYAQQDSQEFMSFLLDGLHEDLNRNRAKPYTEQVESDGRPDAEVANEQWRRHLLRNDSVVVDHCHGLLKSHLTCCDCGNDSVTFDPYLSLSLPLPVATTRLVRVVFLKADLSLRPIRMTAELESRSSLGDVRSWIADQMGVPAACLSLTDVWQHKVTKTFKDSHPLSEVREDTEVWAHELDQLPGADAEGGHATEDGQGHDDSRGGTPPSGEDAHDVTVKEKKKTSWPLGGMFGRKKAKGVEAEVGHGEGYPATQYVDLILLQERRSGGYAYGSRMEAFGPPRRVAIPDKATNHDLYERAREMNARFLRPPISPSSDDDSPDPAAEGGDKPADWRLVVAPVYSHQSANAHVAIPDDAAPLAVRASQRKLVGVVYGLGAVDRMDDDEVRLGLTMHASADRAAQRRGGPKASLELGACFDRMIEREQLSATDMWYCSKCKKHVRAHKKLDLWTAPDVLILHLKRFQYLPGTYFVHRQKLEDLVAFPREGLDMGAYVRGPGGGADGKLLYDLFAVSEHSGGLGGGHYTAVARNGEGLPDGPSNWYSFNDSGVSPAEERQIVTHRAYVLFYQRRGSSLRWGGMQPSSAAQPASQPSK